MTGTSINNKVVSDGLKGDSQGRTSAVIRLSEVERGLGEETVVVEDYQSHADRTRRAVEAFVRDRRGISIEQRFWITNTVVVRIDTDRVSLDSVAEIEGVKRIHENFELEDQLQDQPVNGGGDIFDTESSSESVETQSTSEALDDSAVPGAWDEYGSKGDGTRVAVLGTGVDPDHPDIDLADGGWAEFDSDGNQIESEPYDSAERGTAASSLITGGTASGEHIGVVPEAELYHGAVLTGAGGTFSAVVGGIEWAVENDVDIINISFASTTYAEEFITPLHNAQNAGTFVVSAVGDGGEGSSGSPSNLYQTSMAVGALDLDRNIPDYSGGEEIDTEDAWEDDAPDDWPDEYIVPDLVAPGDGVTTAVPGDDYEEKSTTGMASAHTAGVAALTLAISGGTLSPSELKNILEESTTNRPSSKNTREGWGRLNALGAADMAAPDSGVEGTVVDNETGGVDIDGLTVEADTGAAATFDDFGDYTLELSEGEYTITADAFGYVGQSRTVTVPQDSFVTEDFTLDRQLETNLLSEQPRQLSGGESFEISLEVAHADTLTITDLGNFPESEATITVDGTTTDVGEVVGIDDDITEHDIGVSTAEDSSGRISLEIALEGLDDTKIVSTGPTDVHGSLIEVGIIDADGEYGHGIKETLTDGLTTNYRITETTTSSVATDPDEYDVVVAQKLDEDAAEDFVTTTEDTDDIGVVYLDQWSDEWANAIPQYADVTDGISEIDDSNADGIPHYGVLTNHPIVNQFGAESEVRIHVDSWEDHSWFETTDRFDELANVVVEGEGPAGTGLAIDEETQTVLAASLGRSDFAAEDSFTDESNAILSSIVAYVNGGLALTTLLNYDDGDLTTPVEATNVTEVRVENLWEDWEVDNIEAEDSFDNEIDVDGTGIWSFDNPAAAVSVGLNFTIPLSTYTGGTYGLRIAATDGDEWEEINTTFTIN